MTIKIKGKKYKLKSKGAAVIITAAVLAAALVIGLAFYFGGGHSETPASTAGADTDPDYNASAGVIDKDEYNGTVLEETEDAGSDYIDSTLFLGDSNTARFLKVSDTDGSAFTTKNNTIGVVGMGVGAISSLSCMEFSTGLFTMPEAVKILQPERVIITFGTNNLSGSSTDATAFIESYKKQVDAIAEAYPSVDIIVNSIPSVSKTRSYTNVTMTQIDAYNKALAKMCEDSGWKYLNSAEALKDSTSGYSKDGYMESDGLHLSQKGLHALFEYIRTHSYITDDDRPKPLAAIPTIIGVPDGLIQTNPLSNATFQPVSCGANAYDAGDGTCVCNAGYEGDPYAGCTWIEPTAEPTEEATPTPTASAVPSASSAPDTSTEDGCKAASKYWYGNTCYDTSEDAAAAEQQAVINACNATEGMQWDTASSTCVQKTPAPSPSSSSSADDSETIATDTAEECAKAGKFWYSMFCYNSQAEAQPLIDAAITACTPDKGTWNAETLCCDPLKTETETQGSASAAS